jgi:hypothetical protein
MSSIALTRPAPSVPLLLFAWFILAVAAGATGLVKQYPLPLPSLVLGLTAGLLIALWRVQSLRDRVWALGPVPLVALHVTRFVGAAFLVLGARGDLPLAWALPSGWGDIAVAIGALLVLAFATPFHTAGQRRALLSWNVFGLLDMVMVIVGAIRMVIVDPTAATVMERLPMSLLPTFLVPVIVASHVMLFIWLHRAGESDRSAMIAEAPGVAAR